VLEVGPIAEVLGRWGGLGHEHQREEDCSEHLSGLDELLVESEDLRFDLQVALQHLADW